MAMFCEPPRTADSTRTLGVDGPDPPSYLVAVVHAISSAGRPRRTPPGTAGAAGASPELQRNDRHDDAGQRGHCSHNRGNGGGGGPPATAGGIGLHLSNPPGEAAFACSCLSEPGSAPPEAT